MAKLPKIEMADLDAMAAEYSRFAEFIESHKELKKERDMVRVFLSPSPRHEIYQEHSVSLYHYRRRTKATHRLPLLVVPSLVNKPFIMDMLKGESFIEAMLERCGCIASSMSPSRAPGPWPTGPGTEASP